MMAAHSFPTGLMERLPQVRGRYNENVSLADVTWFRVGGAAEVVFRPADKDDLVHFLQNKPADVPVMIMGVGSNLLIRDGGLPGVVIRLGRGFAGVTTDGDTVIAGAGALDVNVSLTAADASIGGLEFLSGIPGTIGGALRMNAGAYGAEMSDVLIKAEAVTPEGELKILDLAQMKFAYRHCGIDASWLFLSATLQGKGGQKSEILTRIDDIKSAREDTQPVRTRTGGSTFANPSDTDLKAWQLIDRAGCRGLIRGGAMVSEKHCNFLINTGAASATDLEGLGEEVRRRVLEEFGVTLHWEIRRVGLHVDGLSEVNDGRIS
ncbi:MAG: UDP-N-acetylmuramate dehydrogenase [Alphaproteobacteria bacterium]|jgi:UDP-N-acetylmuramate dehydrogenase|nr:UDP-N-acetylmuramate dehydrogenase [Alphaproteobacteria bacterium]MBT4966947.1 UDP-N-acetylmuramate dehydrogenase [Alphaproteobacteria bacterium]MBT5160853.1 UDP-N-acetylmuramate dehydrogenase [Alphaproteobacteria bacterium]MBT5919628.1 UDP-N-acetylmuramate dehydrogenase [Alphaproteobacteria bacterium]MBT6386188.1 UDP-N-acetylmuramate dehydrogenase [Alphaproteobacteria bacterium]